MGYYPVRPRVFLLWALPDQRVEDADLFPVGLIALDEFLVFGGDLVVLVIFAGFEDDSQGDIEGLVINRPGQGGIPQAGGEEGHAGMVFQIGVALLKQSFLLPGGVVIEGEKHAMGQHGFLGHCFASKQTVAASGQSHQRYQ